MQASHFKPSRSPYWHLHLKRVGEPVRRFSLKVRDRQNAEQLKAQDIKEFIQERSGILTGIWFLKMSLVVAKSRDAAQIVGLPFRYLGKPFAETFVKPLFLHHAP